MRLIYVAEIALFAGIGYPYNHQLKAERKHCTRLEEAHLLCEAASACADLSSYKALSALILHCNIEHQLQLG